ncbi:hypothetical protein BLOT_014714 [Blomia tropicalis]|nr:hypothetical protein BLOT_014714 [Blomia tropicalis]
MHQFKVSYSTFLSSLFCWTLFIFHVQCNNDFRPFIDSLFLQIDQEDTKIPIPQTNQSNSQRNNYRLITKSEMNESIQSLPKPHKLLSNKIKQPIEKTLIESNVNELRLGLKYLASLNRFDTFGKQLTRRYIFNMFNNFNLKTSKQSFKTPLFDDNGVNIIGVRSGTIRIEHENQSLPIEVNDHILVIGAHYDTVKNTTGLNDNGSGVGVMLELIRLMDYYNCITKYSVLFVAFDLEELGALGSKYFVHEYLIPNELNGKTQQNQYDGAIIMDTLLNFDPNPGTQDIPNDVHLNVPKFSESIKQSNYSGDFLSMFARTNVDIGLSTLIEHKWNEYDQLKEKVIVADNDQINWKRFRMKPMLIDSLSEDKVANNDNLQRHVNMLRSDHLHFWYHNHSTYEHSLEAVLLTDTGPFRGYMRYCYHKMCDDTRFLTVDNVHFVKKTVDVLLQVILQIADGQCYLSGNNAM